MGNNCEYQKQYTLNPSLIGKAGEHRVISELILRNHLIYVPCVDDGVDIIIDDSIKIQIKCGQKQLRRVNKHKYHYMIYSYNFRSAIYNYRNNIVARKAVAHKLEGVDYVILWAIDDDDFYIIPAEKIRGMTSISFTADEERRTQVKWNRWLPYRNSWGILKGDTIENIKPMEELECKNCGYKWMPLTLNPSRCPHCNSRWYQKMYNHICKRCGAKWHSRIEIPSGCAKCHSVLWNKERIQNHRPIMTCAKCGHQWQPQTDTPSRCPRCKARRYVGGVHRECKQCGYKWFSDEHTVCRCPQCDSNKWYIPKENIKLVLA